MAARVAVVVWAVLLVAVRLWGLHIANSSDAELALGAMPLFGEWDLRLGVATGLVVAVGALAVVYGPRLAMQLPGRALVVVVGVAASGWALTLATVDGARVIGESIERDYGEHTHYVDDAGGPTAFLEGYVEAQATYPVHLQAHPPGFPLALWAGEQVGLDGGAWHVTLASAATAAAAAAAIIALADVAGRDLARRAAPFVAIAPVAVWKVNADAVFAGPALVAVALVVVASGCSGRKRNRLAAAGGATFGVGLLLTYGIAPLALPMAAVALVRRQVGVLAVAGAAAAVVLAAPLLAGFWWLDGLSATRRQYVLSIASVRPYEYFVVANLAVAALALGPAIAAGLTELGRPGPRRAWALIGGGTAALVLADVSGLSKSEVERIWQPFFPLVLLAACAVAVTCGSSRRWLALQVAVAVVLQSTLRSPW